MVYWTEREDYRRDHLVRDGKTYEFTARVLNEEFHAGNAVRKMSAVRDRKKHQRRYRQGNVTRADLKAIKTLIDEGLFASQIARQLGLTRNAVIGRATRAGWSFAHEQSEPATVRSGPVNLPHLSCEEALSQPLTASSRQFRHNPHEEEERPYKPSGCQYPQLDSGQRWTELKKAELAGDPPWHYCGKSKGADSESYCDEHYRVTHY